MNKFFSSFLCTVLLNIKPQQDAINKRVGHIHSYNKDRDEIKSERDKDSRLITVQP